MEAGTRAGRPAGVRSTKQDILEAAAESFLAHGYRGTTMRGIAHSVGVDVSTVVHHGGRKHELFASALALEIGPATLLSRVLNRPREQVPHALAVLVSDAWADPQLRRPVELVLATALTDHRVNASIRSYLDTEMLAPLADFIGGRHASARASAVLATVAGVLLTRYALGIASGLEPREPMLTLEPALRTLLIGTPPQLPTHPPARPR